MNTRKDINIGMSYADILDKNKFLEPGEAVAIRNITIFNGMQNAIPPGVIVQLAEHPWIKCDQIESLTSIKSIKKNNGGYRFDGVIRFAIAQHAQPSEKELNEKLRLAFHIELPGQSTANKITLFLRSIRISYPVRLSTISHPATISRYQELPFAVKLRNDSNRMIGSDAEGNRQCYVTIESKSLSPQIVQLYDRQRDCSYALSDEFKRAIFRLKPGKSETISGTIKITDAIPSHSIVSLTFKLHLQSISDQSTHVIQEKKLTYQIVDEYIDNPAADIVLVTNREIYYETIRSWKRLAEKLGSALSVWNVSLYHDFSFTKKRRDGSCLGDELAGKVVIILDNEFYDATSNQMVRASSFFSKHEALIAARDYGIKIYSIGSSANMTDFLMIDRFAKSSLGNKEEIYEKKFSSHPAQESALRDYAKHRSERYEELDPLTRHAVLYQFNPKVIHESFFHKTYLGDLVHLKLLSTTRASICVENRTDMDCRQEDVFRILKLFPFEKKLKCLEKVTNDDYCQIVSDSILSDLIDEFSYLMKCESLKSKNSSELNKLIVALNIFCQYKPDFSESYLAEDKMVPIFNIILLNYFFVVSLQREAGRKHKIINLCYEKIKSYLMEVDPSIDLEHALFKIKMRYTDFSPDEIIELFSSNGKGYFDLQHHIGKVDKMTAAVDDSVSQTSSFTYRQNFFKTNAERDDAIQQQEKECRFGSYKKA